MSSERKSRNVIIGLLCAIIVFMGVGFAASLSSILRINGSADITGTWNVKITGITASNPIGKAEAGNPTFTSTTATFNAKLKEPSDSVTYTVTVQNNGTIKAKLDDVVEALGSQSNDAIVYTLSSSNPARGTSLAPGATQTFDVTVTYAADAQGDKAPTEDELSQTMTLTLTYVQDTAA